MGKKSAKNIVEEWIKNILKVAEDASDTSQIKLKDEYIMQIIGNCNAILSALNCCDDENS